MLQFIEQQRAWLAAMRQDFHRHPELSRREAETNRRIRSILEELGVDYLAPKDNITIAVLKAPAENAKTIAFRCDTDALEVMEMTGLPFQSACPGVMHACGHDAHISMGLGALKTLKAYQAQLKSHVVVIFQPAEEGEQGALSVLETGALPQVDAVYGVHVWPDLPVGTLGLKEGPVCSGTDKIIIDIEGKGGHGAKPEDCHDALLCACQVVNQLQTVVSRRVSPLHTAVLTIGTVEAGTRWNVIAGKAHLTGTMRVFDEQTRSMMIAAIDEIAKAVAAAHQCTARTEVQSLSGIVINHPEAVAFGRRAAQTVFGREGVLSVREAMIGDDFAEYRRLAPSLYVFLGCSEAGQSKYPLHHARFFVPDEAMVYGVKWFCALATQGEAAC